MSRKTQSSGRAFLKALPLGTIIPAFFIALALFQQAGLGEVMRQDWAIALLAFVVGAATVALPRRFPLLAAFIALVAFAAVSRVTAFDAVAYILFVLAGFFFGLFVRALVYQWRSRRAPTQKPI